MQQSSKGLLMHTVNIDFNRLLIFKAIVQSGSLSKAAHLLRQQKSRISRQLTALEQEVGTRLFYRTTRHLQLTSAGEELFKTALPHIHGLEHALEQVSAKTEEVSGRIRITVPEDIGTQLMGNICHSFITKNPKVFLDVHISNERKDLIRESYDLALRIGKLKDSTLIQKEIAILKTGMFLSPSLNAQYGPLTSPEKLRGLPYLSFSAAGETLRFFKAGETRLMKIEPILTSNSFFVLRDLAVKGSGLTVLPLFLAKEAVVGGLLIPTVRGWSLESAPVHIVYPSQKEVPARIRKFIDHLKSHFSTFS
jgi:DNA-binding transcriptional LysR family regulator